MPTSKEEYRAMHEQPMVRCPACRRRGRQGYCNCAAHYLWQNVDHLTIRVSPVTGQRKLVYVPYRKT